eukprot:NODE_28234_length_484_cov_3.240896.p2 GENE.NODE_28234_length_484_cov_3.240896~~NODE_28234_length_484_cov_3.240896.p2  ORF type:complete len:54 (-),score=6.55 NODE_28234_length_484_cov_3.240896:237-398(-)
MFLIFIFFSRFFFFFFFFFFFLFDSAPLEASHCHRASKLLATASVVSPPECFV